MNFLYQIWYKHKAKAERTQLIMVRARSMPEAINKFHDLMGDFDSLTSVHVVKFDGIYLD